MASAGSPRLRKRRSGRQAVLRGGPPSSFGIRGLDFRFFGVPNGARTRNLQSHSLEL